MVVWSEVLVKVGGLIGAEFDLKRFFLEAIGGDFDLVVPWFEAVILVGVIGFIVNSESGKRRSDDGVEGGRFAGIGDSEKDDKNH